MYMHYYHELNEAHRQQLRDEAAHHRLQARLPRHPNLTRHLVGALGIALVALGSRLERLDRIDHPIPYIDHPIHYIDHPIPYIDHPIPYIDHPIHYIDHSIHYIDHSIHYYVGAGLPCPLADLSASTAD